jgi:adenosylcobinamide hydrolase
LNPDLELRSEGALTLATRIWRLPRPLRCVSSAALGGGLGRRSWVLNATVPTDYSCDDPAGDLTELASAAGLSGDGVGLMTAVDVRSAVVVECDGVVVDATVGVRAPMWAAETGTTATASGLPVPPGTINVVAFLPERLSDAALVNAVGTVTEAKVQALIEAGIAGTGTVTDAVCLLCPDDGDAHAYGGPRSIWGARLARAVHEAVRTGLDR